MRRAILLGGFALLSAAANAQRVVGLDQVPPGSKCEQTAILNSFIGQPASTELAARREELCVSHGLPRPERTSARAN